MVACGSLPCGRFLRFSCLAGRASGFAELLSGCLLLLQTPLVVSSPPPQSFIGSTGLLWSSKALPELKLDTLRPTLPPHPYPYPLALGRKWPGGTREWHGIIIFLVHLFLHLGFLTTPLMIPLWLNFAPLKGSVHLTRHQLTKL